jgi:nucleotide-binding universal stress UspA family protein
LLRRHFVRRQDDFCGSAAKGVSMTAARQARWRKIVRAGDARSIVLDEAVRGQVDVIAIGTHGRSGLSRAVIGSVAEDVIVNAPCDVLVARSVRTSLALP